MAEPGVLTAAGASASEAAATIARLAPSRDELKRWYALMHLGRLLDDIPAQGPGPDDVQELRRVLYGLFAVLRLHFAQEDEAYFSMLDHDGHEAIPLPSMNPPTDVAS